MTSPSVAPLVGDTAAIQTAARLSHGALYGFMGVMSVTGVLMGLFGGKGLPFFFTTVPSVSESKTVAGNSYSVHKFTGTYLKYLVPLHIGAAGFHVAKGQAIFARINPLK